MDWASVVVWIGLGYWKDYRVLLVFHEKGMTRKNVLMKNNIPGSKKFLSVKIIDTIALLPTRIPEKNATMCSFIKFVFRGEISGIT